MLEFEVNGQRLRLKGNLYVVAESIDYLKARFAFSADWDGAAKTAIFKTADRKGVYNVILDENGICTVPSEVIHAPRFYVSVFGGSRITANEVEVQCNVSGYAEGSAPDTPTPEVYEQILAAINKKVSKVDGMGLSENSYTTEEKTKLDGIADGAEVNVQSDWSQTNAGADDYIKNKPTSLPASDVYDWAKQPEKPTYTAAEVGALPSNTVIPSYSVATQSKDGLMSAADKIKLDGLSEGGGGGKETDPTVPSWAKQPEKPKYTAAEVGADSTGSAANALSDAKTYIDGKVKTNVPENALFTDTVYDDTEIKTALGSEETARTKADTTLQNNINSEASARSSADTTLQSNITNEATARINADDTLQGNLDAHASDTGNPHSVTKSQVGLGNVPNVATNDQTPTYTQASTLANLTSGEKLSVSLGKIMKAIADFITHKNSTSNPHSVTKSQVGLGNVPNVATNSQTPTYGVASSLSSLTSGETLSTAFGKIAKAVSDFISHIGNTDNPHSVTKSQVGLGNVDNTSDADKPISTAMQTALNRKLDKSGGTMNIGATIKFTTNTDDRSNEYGSGTIHNIRTNGQWASDAITYITQDASKTNFGGFGAYGPPNTLEYFFVGAWNDCLLQIYRANGKIYFKNSNGYTALDTITANLNKSLHSASSTPYDTGRVWVDGNTIFRVDFSIKVNDIGKYVAGKIPIRLINDVLQSIIIINSNVTTRNNGSASIYGDLGDYNISFEPATGCAEFVGFIEYIDTDTTTYTVTID